MSIRLQFFAMQLALLGLWAWLSFGCGASSLVNGYKAVTAIAQARDATSKVLVELCSTKHDECVLEHGINTDGYKQCVEECSKALEYWSRIGHPGVQAALKLTIAALDIAHAAKKKDVDWMKHAGPGICAIVQAVAEFKQLIGDRGKQILAYLELGAKYVCATKDAK